MTAHILKERRGEIINLLKRCGGMTADALATELKLTKVGVRRHLDLLEKHGLVTFRSEWRERGRPHHVYSLTGKAEELFPKAYDTLAKDILRITHQCFGERGVLRVITQRTDEIIESYRPHLEGLCFDDRVERLAAILVERGYLAEFQRLADGSYMLIERNCPTINVASEFSQICQQEKRIYAEVLGCEVIRENRIAGGDQACAYRILKPSDGNGQSALGLCQD